LSPGSLQDTAIFAEYFNTSTSLGLTEQIYTATGTQSIGLSYKFLDSYYTPEENLMLLEIKNAAVISESGIAVRECFNLR
jgi:hypothetical protein